MCKAICIISHQHLCRNPRVLKEALAISKLQYSVTILTSVYSEKLLLEDLALLSSCNATYKYYNDLTKKSKINFFIRAKNKLGRWLNYLGVENVSALGYAPNMCLNMAVQLDADLYICHQELPTYVGVQLLKLGKKVAFDFEDWYHEDLLPMARKFRPQKLLAEIEYFALHNASVCYTTSLPMANAMATRYSFKNPEIIFNSFETFKDISLPFHSDAIKLIWLSQTIGPGRGLEDILHSMNCITHVKLELNLCGAVTTSYKDTLQTSLNNVKHCIKFLPLIPNNEIQKDLVKYDLGIASELKTPNSRDLTLTNKIFHYLSVGLPVVASSTKGQLSLKDDFIDSIFYYQNISELVNIFSNLTRESLNNKRAKILENYQKNYDWSLMENKLQNIVKHILS